MAAAQHLEDIQVASVNQHEITLMELVSAVAETAETDAEVIAVVADLINTGRVQLVGSFLGADVRVG